MQQLTGGVTYLNSLWGVGYFHVVGLSLDVLRGCRRSRLFLDLRWRRGRPFTVLAFISGLLLVIVSRFDLGTFSLGALTLPVSVASLLALP